MIHNESQTALEVEIRSLNEGYKYAIKYFPNSKNSIKKIEIIHPHRNTSGYHIPLWLKNKKAMKRKWTCLEDKFSKQGEVMTYSTIRK